MILKQYYLTCLAHASYLLGDETTRTAVVVDPQRDVVGYLEDAAQLGLEIRHVFLTHFHADFVAGHLELREQTGARIHLGAQANAEYDFEPAADGDRLEWGALRLGILETPGHTPEAISIVVSDLDQGEQPLAVLTGDTLFIGDVGRPDLMASIGTTAEELATQLYHSLHDKLLHLPDETLVYPAHGAGSMCGKNLSKETVSTIGAQRRQNYALQPMSEAEFVAMSTSALPNAPQYFAYDAMLNRQERGTLEARLSSLGGLTFDEVMDLQQRAHVQVVDTRPVESFALRHLKGSYSIALDGSFATWSGTLLDPNNPIVIVAEAGQETEAALRLGRIGFDQVAGFLEGGITDIETHPEAQGQLPRVTPDEIEPRLEGQNPPIILDVRTVGEWNDRHVPGSLNIPLDELSQRLPEVATESDLVVMCRTGYRSSAASSLLLAAGYPHVHDLVGGIVHWQERGARCETQDGSASCSES